MSILAVHTSVVRDGLPVHFAPGDTVPEWASDLIGSHCLVADPETVTGPDASPEPVEVKNDTGDPETVTGPDASPEPVEVKNDTGDPETVTGPDFTKPAPAKRKPGRPRKIQG